MNSKMSFGPIDNPNILIKSLSDIRIALCHTFTEDVMEELVS
jgi:hypothetical protein